MNLEIGNLKILNESYDFRNRLKSRKEALQVKIQYRVVLEEKHSGQDEDKQKANIMFREIRVLSQRGILSDIYIASKVEELIIEKVRKQQCTIFLPSYLSRLTIAGDSDQILMLINGIQQSTSLTTLPLQKPLQKEAPCPLRSDILSLPNNSAFSPINVNDSESLREEELDKENMINRFNSVKGKLKFSDLLTSDATGFTPKLKKIYQPCESSPVNEESATNKEELNTVFPFASHTQNRPLPQVNDQTVTLPHKQGTFRRRLYAGVEKFSEKSIKPVHSSSLNYQPNETVPKVIRNLSQEINFQKEIVLSLEQEQILTKCLEGESLFVTGGGGSGKSTLLKKVIEECTRKYGLNSVYVTATTGLAAFAIGGITIHQYLTLPAIDFELSNSEEVIQSTVQKIISKKVVVQRCQQTKVLIIDEVSMLDPRLFEIINEILQKTRENTTATFGGIQVIVCGDFFQLPPIRSTPVQNSIAAALTKQSKDQELRRSRYCFESKIWKESFTGHSYELQIIHRQSNDSEYLSILNNLRFGVLAAEELSKLNSQCFQRKLLPQHDILPTQIYTHKKDVDSVNQKNLTELKAKAFEYTARDSGDEIYLKSLQSQCPVKSKISLKIGAQVMLVKTMDTLQGLVNGARGVVVRFIRETNCPVVKFENGEEHIIMQSEFVIRIGEKIVARRLQIPLELSWAISVHKAQGITVSQAELHLQNSFEYGQIYVALSRVSTLQGVSLKSIIPMNKIVCDPIVLSYYRSTFERRSIQL